MCCRNAYTVPADDLAQRAQGELYACGLSSSLPPASSPMPLLASQYDAAGQFQI